MESEMATGFKSAELSLPSLTVSPLSNRVPLGFKKLKASYAAETGAWTGEATLFSVPSGVPGLMFGPVESDGPSLTVKVTIGGRGVPGEFSGYRCRDLT